MMQSGDGEYEPRVLGVNTLRRSVKATKPTNAEWCYIVVLLSGARMLGYIVRELVH